MQTQNKTHCLVARDLGQDNGGDRDVIMGDEDNTRSQSLGTRMNEHHAGGKEGNGHELRVEESKPSMATCRLYEHSCFWQ